jgi:hypothetical protein
VLDDAVAMGLPPDDSRVGPEAVMGIEINGYAAELARLTVWITELQWQLRKGLGLTRRPILDKLDGIARADALITQSGRDSEWPQADVWSGTRPSSAGRNFDKHSVMPMWSAFSPPSSVVCRRKPIWSPIGLRKPGSGCETDG